MVKQILSATCRTALTAATLALSLLIMTPAALAQGDVRDIDFPAQPLQQALTATGQAFGVTVVAPGDMVRDRMAPAVTGRFTADEVVSRLLHGSNLAARRSANNAIVIVDSAAREADADSEPATGMDTGSGLRLAPVIVTGERAERTLYDTASSASVVSGRDIDNTPAFKEVSDLLQYTPNVDLGGKSNEGPTIRGIKAGGPLGGVYAFFGGSRPRATITVDGRPVSFNEFIFGATSVWDVDRVEVFRGPQTTSQGVNSIAGAIHVVTADPTFEHKAKAQAEVGDYRSGRLSASLSGPVVDEELAFIVSGDMRRRDSFVDIQPTDDYGPDPNTILNGTVRGKLLWEPSAVPEMKMKLTLTRVHNEGPQAEYVKKPYKDLKSISVNLPSWHVISNAGIHDVSYEFSDAVEVSNRLSYAAVSSRRYVDMENAGTATTDKGELSNETIMRWQAEDSGLSGLAGVFLQRSYADEYLNYSIAGVGSFKDLQTGVGLFTEATYDITDRLDLTLGLRFESDRQHRTGLTTGGSLYNVDFDYDKTFNALLPKAVLGYDVTDDLRIGAMVSRGFNPGGVTVLWSDGTLNTFDEETVWNYELFARTRMLDDRLQLNANLFYARYEDYQLNYQAGVAFGSVIYGIANAEEAHSYGLELSADYLATDSLRLFGGLGLLKTKIDKFTKAGGINAEGASFMRSPDITLSLGADYEIIDGLRLGGRARYVGKYKSEDTRDSLSAGDYTVVDLQASYNLASFTLYGYVNNVFDKFYTVSELQIGRAIVGNPREFGVGVKYEF
ncbi:TonB-dependent receptor domain-containing protein [Pseudodesulfovibrio alkaliphilus]|uniref:TonB-dependent receptor domain-containing protein n=1 Tax=Pseudodesulfovibrio alkaliphilus TaxID=2661613 RepID=UPI0018C8C06E